MIVLVSIITIGYNQVCNQILSKGNWYSRNWLGNFFVGKVCIISLSLQNNSTLTLDTLLDSSLF